MILAPAARPRVSGKFLFVGDEKLYVRGVTYGAFRPDQDGNEFENQDTIERDFALMAANGLTCVRIPHTTPPRSLLDIAARHGLRVMVGLSAEQYIGFLIDKEGAPDIDEIIGAKVRSCAGHPALLCYAIGNEIPASIVRWLGRRTVERFLERIYRVVKREDPEGLVTYVNYPSTEYLQLPFLDLVCFNVYLESEDRLTAYLKRIQNIAGDRPLILSEVGLDSLRNGEDKQADVLDWQIRAAFSGGCAGIFIFSWTDEWYRGGADVDDWAFGITDRNRNPKPALKAVREALTEVPFPRDLDWPRVSVVVCTHNGAKTIRECCEGLSRLEYPDFEVIVVDDGSSDDSKSIAREYGYRVISTDHGGLSNARNVGWKAATGTIVAYLDDDAYPDPHWLAYLAASFLNSRHGGIGGPNITPPADGAIADCVANSPGNPTHVLLSDEIAEHIPGCNMAFRKAALEAVGGFDTQFRVAGDDVDICWKLRQHGYSLGFSPAAFVWHHRRNSLRAFWRQQINYGKAEGALERKWPEKYQLIGHHDWKGRIYGNGSNGANGLQRWRIYHGVWGSAPFQSLYESDPGRLQSLALRPEWWLIVSTLLVLSALGVLWKPLLLALIPLGFALTLSLTQAAAKASRASFPHRSGSSWGQRLILKGLTASLHILQPLARLWGRLRSGFAPWRAQGTLHFALPRPRSTKIWSEDWRAPEKRLESIEQGLRATGATVVRGGDFDPWDLEVRGGLFGTIRISMAVEDHGSGTQLVRLRARPRLVRFVPPLALLTATLAALAAIDQSWMASIALAAGSLALAGRALIDCAVAKASYLKVLQSATAEQDPHR
jgi:GT2 family glycosyltransferase